jgi:hypothetical protein
MPKKAKKHIIPAATRTGYSRNTVAIVWAVAAVSPLGRALVALVPDHCSFLARRD